VTERDQCKAQDGDKGGISLDHTNTARNLVEMATGRTEVC